MLAHRGILIHHNVGILSYYLSLHAPSGSNSSLLLLGDMSSQQDISPPLDHTLLPLTYDPPPLVLAGYRLVKFGPYVCSTSACVQDLPVVFAVV